MLYLHCKNGIGNLLMETIVLIFFLNQFFKKNNNRIKIDNHCCRNRLSFLSVSCREKKFQIKKIVGYDLEQGIISKNAVTSHQVFCYCAVELSVGWVANALSTLLRYLPIFRHRKRIACYILPVPQTAEYPFCLKFFWRCCDSQTFRHFWNILVFDSSVRMSNCVRIFSQQEKNASSSETNFVYLVWCRLIFDERSVWQVSGARATVRLLLTTAPNNLLHTFCSS